MGIINQYPYTDLHSINLDYIIKLCRENMGLHLEISGNNLLLKTEDNTIISSVTIPYATEAGSANTATNANYATSSGVAATANYATTAGSATTADTATNATHAVTADSATSATTANSAATANYATSAGSANTATTATSASTADFATNAGSVAHTTNGIETVTVDGNEIKFSTYGGNTTSITSPYSVKASKDDIGNIIKNTYVANVVDDSGVLKFNDAQGNTLVSLTPTAAIATSDSYNNTIADYIKTILVSSNSDYVTVTHGTGTTDSLTIHYSETAWKDTNGNVIKNTYIKRMECIVDPNDSKYKLVAYNGDTPEAEIFRIELTCENAKHAFEADHATSADSATLAINSPNAIHHATRYGDRIGFYNYNNMFMGEVFAYEYITPYRLTVISGSPFDILAASFAVNDTKAFTAEITLESLEDIIGYNKYCLVDFGETLLVMPTAIINRASFIYICFDLFSTDDNTHRSFELYTDTSDSTGLTVLIKRIS